MSLAAPPVPAPANPSPPLLPEEASLQALPMTPEAYHAFLPRAPHKYEFHDGKAIPMAGASFEHVIITGNFSRELGNALEEAGASCDVLTSDLKVYIRRRKIYLPDVAVACDPAQIDENDCLRNPVLIIEVLSPSTAIFDQNEKFRDYRTLPSLRHYVTVQQDRADVLHYARTDSGQWAIVGDYTTLDAILTFDLGGKTIAVPLARIYRRIALTPTSDDPENEPEEAQS